MANVKVIINGKQVEVDGSTTILEAANLAGVDIPRLCFLKGINENSSCRLCVVEVEGIRTLKNSCCVKVADCLARGSDTVVVKTNTPRVLNAVKSNLKLIAGNHRFECWKCPREHNCELLRLLRKFNIENTIGEDPTFSMKERHINLSDAIEFDSSKCVLCGRCISACEKLAGTSVLNYNNRGSQTYVGPALNFKIDNSGCIYCGKCIQACPVGAIKEKDDIDLAQSFVDNKEYYTVAFMAPSVRAALAEEFGYKVGEMNAEGKIYDALRKIGVDDICDVNFAADVTIMEEGTEFISRLNRYLNGDETALPLFTSCSPGWIRFIETYYPEFLPNLSSCKSPQQMQGALTKTYYAKKLNLDPTKIRTISIMPCIAKKFEAKRKEMEVDGLRDIDVVLTTRELARWIKRNDINFNELEDYVPTSPMAKYTGAGVIFGVTGGVMEAALRSVKDILEKRDNKEIDITPVRGVADIKEATLTIAGKELTVAVVHGGANIHEMLKKIKENPKKYAFVEFMGCTGGCVNGGGQPVVPSYIQDKIDVREERAKVLYDIDKNSKLRKSHENPFVQELYKEYLGEPNSELAHKLLHTHYEKKSKYDLDK